jgi:hypothetical protein
VKEHLVAYEYGMGMAWGYVVAGSPAEIEAVVPDVDIVSEPPHWMTTEDLGAVREYCTFTLEEASPESLIEAKKLVGLSAAPQ